MYTYGRNLNEPSEKKLYRKKSKQFIVYSLKHLKKHGLKMSVSELDLMMLFSRRESYRQFHGAHVPREKAPLS